MFHHLVHFIRKKSKLHFLDYVVIIFVIISISALLYARFTKKTEWVKVSIRLQPDYLWSDATPKPWYASAFLLHEKAYNSFGQKVAEVSDIHTIETQNGKIDIVVDVSLKSSVDTRRKQYIYNYQPVLIGKPIELLFQHASLNGVVVSINSPIQYVDKIIEIQLLAEFPWKVPLLAKGLQAKDYAGKVTAEILDIKSQDALSYELYDMQKRRIFSPTLDPNRKDVTIKLKIKALKYKNLLYSIAGSPLKVGANFQIQFPNISLDIAIISSIFNE